MASGGKGRLLFLVAGAVCLVAAAVMWWDVIRDGVTLSGIFRPGLFTLIGLFWLFYGFRANRAQQSSDSHNTGQV